MDPENSLNEENFVQEENLIDNTDKPKKSGKKKKEKTKQSKFATWWKWPLIVLAVSLILSFSFGLLSEISLSRASLAIAIVVICVLVVLSVVGDMIGVAATAAKFEPFRAMASRKVRGANEAIILVKNADKVTSVFADILGDICGILAGAAGASISSLLIREAMPNFVGIVIASAVSAVIAALIIFGKAIFKRYSILHCEKIILICGKVMSIFHRQNKKTKKKREKKTQGLQKNH